jgi:hypothetical protein
VAVKVRPAPLLLPLLLFESKEVREGRLKDRDVCRSGGWLVLVVGVGRWRDCDGIARERGVEGLFIRRLRCRGSPEGLMLCAVMRDGDGDVGLLAWRQAVGMVFFFPCSGILLGSFLHAGSGRAEDL